MWVFYSEAGLTLSLDVRHTRHATQWQYCWNKERLRLISVAGTGGQAVRHYQFSDSGEMRVRGWIYSHLQYSVYPIEIGGKDARVELKKKLVLAQEPPLNLQHWDNRQEPKITALRPVCKDEAARSQ